MIEGLKAEDRGMFRMLSPQLSHNFTNYTSPVTSTRPHRFAARGLARRLAGDSLIEHESGASVGAEHPPFSRITSHSLSPCVRP